MLDQVAQAFLQLQCYHLIFVYFIFFKGKFGFFNLLKTSSKLYMKWNTDKVCWVVVKLHELIYTLLPQKKEEQILSAEYLAVEENPT